MHGKERQDEWEGREGTNGKEPCKLISTEVTLSFVVKLGPGLFEEPDLLAGEGGLARESEDVGEGFDDHTWMIKGKASL
jgi:hypothetical protein